MRTRKEVAAYINAGGKGFEMKHTEKGSCYHFGLQDLRVLMDYIYGDVPSNEEERLKGGNELNAFD